MTRRKGATSVKVLEKLVQQKEQPPKSFQETSEEFLKHCKIKGLSPDTVQFYRKELKGLSRVLAEVDVPLKDVRAVKIQDVENWVEYMLEMKRAVSSINARMRAGRTFMAYCQNSIDTTTAVGKAMFRMLAVLSEMERDLISERTKAGLESARARGRSGGRPKKDKKDIEKALKLYDTEQYTVKEIEEMTNVSKATLYREIRKRKSKKAVV